MGILLLCLAIVEPSLAAEDPTAEIHWGRPVIGINLDTDAQLSLAEFSPEIIQKVGEPLDRGKVSQSLRNLYETGRFRDVRADVQDKSQGIVLVFVGRAQRFVGLLRVEGAPKRLESTSLVSVSRLRLGQPFSEDDLEQARERIAKLLTDNALYRARVSYRVLQHADDQEADITFSIAPGKEARLGEMDFEGHPAVPPARLANVARWKSGRILTSDKLDSGLLRLHNFYVKLNRLQATTSVQKRTYDPEANRERLIVQAESGPEIFVHVSGAHISSRNLRRVLPIYREGAVDQLALLQGNSKLEDYFEEQGYFSAKATVGASRSPDRQRADVTYTVTLGPRGEFVGFAFKGNKSIDEDDLQAVMQIQPETFPRFRGIFTRAYLDHDITAMTTLYQARGFPDIKITPQVSEDYKGKKGDLFVTFNIEEGVQVTVGKLIWRGMSTELEKNFRGALLASEGQAFSPARAQSDKETLLTYLENQGYPHTVVNWKASAPSPTHQVTLEYAIDPGPRETVREILLMGNQHTRNSVVDRELTFDAGEPLSQSKLLESQQRLYDMSVFNQVQIATQDPQSPQTQKTVLVSVEEARRWTVEYGFGVDVQSVGNNQPQGQTTASPRLSLQATRLNVFGRAQTLTAAGRLSNLETGGSLSYLIPRFARRRGLDLRLTGLALRTRDVATFTLRRQEGNLILTKQYSTHGSLSGGYSYKHLEVLDLNTTRISQAQIPLLSQPVRVAMLTSGYANDHRDNAADATAGSYSLLGGGVAWTRLGSQANFLRLTGQNATYYRLRPHLIFARNTRIGVESPFGPLIPFDTVLTHDIPLAERFFMGGSESHRGFGLNQAGPRDSTTGFPLGGNTQVLNTFELRVPFARNRLGLVLFHDAGNVYSSVRRMRVFKFSQSSPTDFDYTVHAVGTGLRYQTPVGPLRFDVAYSLNPPRFRRCTDTSNPQSCAATGQGFIIDRLPHFQFFISVGQSF